MIQPSTINLVAALIGALAFLTLALAVFLPYGSATTRSECAGSGEKEVSSLASRIPISEIRDDLIIRRDGSFCAGWECVGIATQFASAERIEAMSSSLDAFIKGFRHPEIELQFRYVVDHKTPQVLEDRKTSANCVNSPAAWLEENRLSFWRSAIDAGQVRSIKLIVLLSWRPTRTWETRSAISRFAAAFWNGLARQGFSKLPSVIRLALTEAKTKALVQRNRIEHNRLVAEFNQLLGTYSIGLEAITPVRRLREPELAGLVYQSFNPADPQPANQSRDLESLLNTDWSEGVRFVDLGGIVRAVVTLSELPEATYASLPRPILALDFPCEVVLSVRVPDQAAKVRKLRHLLKKSLAFQLRTDGSRRRDFQAAALEKDSVDTLTSAVTSSQRLVEIELAAIVSSSKVARTAAERDKAELELAQRVLSSFQRHQ